MKRFNKMTESYMSKANGGAIPGAIWWGIGLTTAGMSLGATTGYLGTAKKKS